jgi:cell division protease FtsH
MSNSQPGQQPSKQPFQQPKASSAGPQKPDDKQPNLLAPMRRPNFWVTLLLLFALNYFLINLLFPDPQEEIVTISYTFFKQQVAAGNVREITARGEDIQGLFNEPVLRSQDPLFAEAQVNADATAGTTAEPTLAATEAPAGGLFGGPREEPSFTRFATVKPIFVDQELLPLLEANQVVISARPLAESRSPLWTFLLAFGPTLLLIGGFLWLNSRLMRGAGGGAFGLGRSRARRYDAETTTNRVTFEDVAGIDEVEAELVEIVDLLKNPDKYRKLGAEIPRGVLLIGPPGTGKTLLARAVAGEANVPFFSLSGSEFVEMVVGVGAARVRDLFKQAREASPSIIFIDEIDAIGGRRGGNTFGGNDEREQTLNQILTEMDGFDPSTTVIVLAATNRSDVLDPALLRPGRFDRRVTVQPPDKQGRFEILSIHTRDTPLGPDVSLEGIAATTPGATGAELRNLVNEASLLAARRDQTQVSMQDFRDALEKMILGAERRLLMRPEERERVAYHEAGHALCGLLQPESDPVRRVTIVPRAQALGVTLSIPEEDRWNYTEEYLRARIVNAFGGRAAELVVYGNVTTGAENDLMQITNMARAMVMRFGMSNEVGQVQLISASEGNYLDSGLQRQPYSEATAQAADKAVRKIVDDSFAKAIKLLTDNRQRLDAMVEALLRDETLDEQQIRAVTGLTLAHTPGKIPAVVNHDDSGLGIEAVARADVQQ